MELESKPQYFHLPKAANPQDPRVVEHNSSASLVDIGDGIACLNLHSKMNAINTDITELILKSVQLVEKRF